MLYVVLGDGEMTSKELGANLQDLWERTGDEPFWFIVQGKSDPTATDKAMIKWFTTNEIYWEIFCDDPNAVDDVYEGAQKTHTARKLPEKVVKLLETGPDEDEGDTGSMALALFVSDDPEAEEDRWLSGVLGQVAAAGITTLVLNDGLVEIDVSEGAAEAEEEPAAEEPEPEPTPRKKAPAKKAAAKAPEPEPEPEESELADADDFTREQLEEMELPQLKEIAAARGVTLPPRSRMGTYVDAILDGPAVPPEAEVEEPEEEADTEPEDQATMAATEFASLVEDLANDVIEAVRKGLKEMFAKL